MQKKERKNERTKERTKERKKERRKKQFTNHGSCRWQCVCVCVCVYHPGSFSIMKVIALVNHHAKQCKQFMLCCPKFRTLFSKQSSWEKGLVVPQLTPSYNFGVSHREEKPRGHIFLLKVPNIQRHRRKGLTRGKVPTKMPQPLMTSCV